MHRFIEGLESRRLLSVAVISVVKGTLSIRADSTAPAAISVSLADDAGLVTVNVNSAAQTFAASTINRIVITGAGKFANTIVSSLVVPTTITGGNLADDITAPDVSTAIRSLNGNDKITIVPTDAPPVRINAGVFIDAGNGDDTIFGGNRADTIRGSNGNDTIHAGNGDNFIEAGNGNDTVTAGNGDNQILLRNGNDFLTALAGSNKVFGGSGDDSITVGTATSTAKNFVKGDHGNDSITGGNGNDRLIGNAGNDTIRGMAGNDTLFGDAGSDTLDGGTGSNSLVAFSGRDFVTASPVSDSDKNKYYTNGRADINPAMRRGIDQKIMRDLGGGDGFSIGPGDFLPF